MQFGQKVEQIAYVVPNVWEAAARHSKLYGSGPFFAMDHAPVADVWYRGGPASLDPNVALGQCGDLMIELLQDNGTGPSILNDLYPQGSGRTGIHHLCYHIDHLAASLKYLDDEGFPVVFRTRMAGGTDVAIVDTTPLHGHFIELYEKTEEIKGLYRIIREAAQGFDGRDPVRPMGALLSAK